LDESLQAMKLGHSDEEHSKKVREVDGTFNFIAISILNLIISVI
jgi:hypothetical protein